ncbi:MULTISPECIES: DNA ligase D [unclassified Mesorhizobium]|uniref:DNA ligase D n=1 Tax=unclassified Mesorhizobium TaxID=325217 RepID=UPI0003CF2A0C|nr:MULTISPECIES: DNA ligase D [unclassified Mesorhizobium]ESX17285.1 ATP-dependent DNA ligase [Mesorhizobium sp. LSJC255A00]ESX21208.1 ATP-dependent DNA ligase [Mesorhizobium sp. LSHC440B00]ESX33434.1 ATP-dependent DNA ligase [Mesorhizobium sp. LSHC432A00]ESX34091.1 ATP-dependent DNA ligase [Mesorhizobium sp. LSHC440A00]ESX76871.1 ATP-dependent DNA ligase [Mesorhizobium sp. LSHC414A00]
MTSAIDRLSFIEFQSPTLVEKAPEGGDWLHEIKYDGYRTQLVVEGGKARAFTRRGYDWSHRYKGIVQAAASLPVKSAIIDGEAVVLGDTGLPDYQALERELGNPSSLRMTLYAFDLLYLDGRDLREQPLVKRKAALKKLLTETEPTLTYAEHLEVNGKDMFDHACRMGIEGIVSKRADAHYRSGVQTSWVKVKCVKSDTFPIVAFVEKLGAQPRRIASLYIGRREGDRLLYAGKAQTGYTLDAARRVRERLDPLVVAKSPLSEPIKKPKATWVKPDVLAEVQFSGVSDRGILREAVFKGLREDLQAIPPKPPSPSKRRSDGQHGVPRENILQLLPDAVAPSKEELADYWRRVADQALVHLVRRPLKLVRHASGATFYHKGPLPRIPASVHQLRVQKREGGEGIRVWIDDMDGLLGLVEMDAVELHLWNATIDDIEHADRLVLDLDPGEGVPWDAVIEATLALRGILEAAGLESWPKVTGGKGIHLMAPLVAKMNHDSARKLAKSLAHRLVDTDPDRYLLSADPAARGGRIFLDYLRNGRGNTAIGAFSPRARLGFPIAHPVTWKQVEAGIRPDVFTLAQPFRPARRKAA